MPRSACGRHWYLNMLQTLYQFRFVPVIALLCVAAALLTEKGRLPLALRGVRKILRRDAGLPGTSADEARGVPAWKRLLAFVLILLAFGIAVV